MTHDNDNDDAAAGMAWWNALPEAERGEWLALARSAVAADAWATHRKAVAWMTELNAEALRRGLTSEAWPLPATITRRISCWTEDFQRGLTPAQALDAAAPATPIVSLTCTLTEDEAWALAQLVKRMGFSDFRAQAQNEEEAYAMRDAADQLRQVLELAGYAPR